MEQPAATGAAQVVARMDEYLAALRQAGEAEQAAVGNGLNAAYAVFREAFKSESAFRAAGEEAQRQFLLRLNATMEKMDPQSGAAWGFRLFWMYARLMTEEDPQLALGYGPELEQLGAKGRSGAQ
jgi:hypothetical protein